MWELHDPDENQSYRTYIPQELLDGYNISLGRMLGAFAALESSLGLRLNDLIRDAIGPEIPFIDGLSEDEGRRVVSGIINVQQNARNMLRQTVVLKLITRRFTLEDCKLLIIKIMGVMDYDASAVSGVKQIFKHLDDINFMRNTLVHNGASPDATNKEGWFYTTNMHVDVKWRVIYFKPCMLDAMAWDLSVMSDRIMNFLNPEFVGSVYREIAKTDEELKKLQEFFNSFRSGAEPDDRNGPWRYNPKELRDKNVVPDPASE